MATFERAVRVDALLSDTWAFHSTIDCLRSVTPNWLHLRIDQIEQPDGEPETNVLHAGTRIHASVQPFGVGPRQRWVSRIVEREADDSTAYFVDVMEDGPFPEWQHTHLFYADDDQTLVRDRVEYSAPGGGVGDELAGVFLGPMFRYRHRRTREILDDE